MTPATHLAALITADRVLGAADPLMRRLVARHGPCALKPHWRRGPYESLVRAVMHQQLHGNAAAAILARFAALHPGRSEDHTTELQSPLA
jgi:DNA-3-methyladenine glycosylase II